MNRSRISRPSTRHLRGRYPLHPPGPISSALLQLCLPPSRGQCFCAGPRVTPTYPRHNGIPASVTQGPAHRPQATTTSGSLECTVTPIQTRVRHGPPDFGDGFIRALEPYWISLNRSARDWLHAFQHASAVPKIETAKALDFSPALSARQAGRSTASRTFSVSQPHEPRRNLPCSASGQRRSCSGECNYILRVRRIAEQCSTYTLCTFCEKAARQHRTGRTDSMDQAIIKLSFRA